MNTRSKLVLKLLIWVLYIISNALSIFWLVQGWFTIGFDALTFAYLPMNLIYSLGGLYVAWNLDMLLPRYRKKLRRILIVLFGVDAIYAFMLTFIGIKYPQLFNPPMDVEAGLIIKGSLFGFGFALLVLFAILRLIDQASNVPDKKFPVWMTILGWLIIASMVAGVVFYGLSK